jgi:hypothetical protein
LNSWRPAGLILPKLKLSDTEKAKAGGLPFPGDQNLQPEIRGIVTWYQELWKWQDSCIAIMEVFRNTVPTPPYDFSPFEAAFGSLARLDSVGGNYYSAVVAALEEWLRNDIEIEYWVCFFFRFVSFLFFPH